MTGHAQSRRGASSSANLRSSARRAPAGCARSGAMPDILNGSSSVRRTAQLKAALNSRSGVAQLNGGGKGGDAGWLSNWFKRHVYGTHQYDVVHPAYGPQPGESDDEVAAKVYDALTKTGAPGTSLQSTPTPQNIWMLLGKISTQSNPNERSVTNIPKVPHLLYPWFGGEEGEVKRQVEGPNIRTKGKGTGLFPSANEALADVLWGSMAHKARLLIDPPYKNQHEKDVEKQRASMMRMWSVD